MSIDRWSPFSRSWRRVSTKRRPAAVPPTSGTVAAGSRIRRATALCLVATIVAFGNACSMPRIIILNDPLSAEEHVKLGRIYESQGKADLAAQHYETAVKADPKSITALLFLGDISFRNDNYETAESAYIKAIALQPENGDIYNNLSLVYLKQDRHLEKAEDLIQKALIATPEHRGYYLDTRGMVLLKLNRAEEAITALHEAVKLIPEDQSDYLAEAYAHLAEAYRKSGDDVRAREAQSGAESRRKQ